MLKSPSNQIFSKSQAAFILSCERLFDCYPKCYFWTFTFVDCMPDWWYPKHWSRFVRDLSDLYGGCLFGMKVLEPHTEHGLHYHAILNRRVSVHLVRRIGKRYGIGRVQVKRADMGSAYYLAKYLSKGGAIHKGMHRWNTVGGFVGVKCKNIEIDSPYHRTMKKLCFGQKVGFGVASQIFRFSRLHGDFEDWPKGCRDYASAATCGFASREALLRLAVLVPKHSRHVVYKIQPEEKQGVKKYYLKHDKSFHRRPIVDKPSEVTQRNPVYGIFVYRASERNSEGVRLVLLSHRTTESPDHGYVVAEVGLDGVFRNGIKMPTSEKWRAELQFTARATEKGCEIF